MQWEEETQPEQETQLAPQPADEVDEEGFQMVSYSRQRPPRPTQACSQALQCQQGQPRVLPRTTVIRGITDQDSLAALLRRAEIIPRPFEHQRVGIIVQHLDIRRSINPNDQIGHPGIWEGLDKKPWYKKRRYWLIVADYDEQIAEIPIYTYGNRGLDFKPPNKHWQYISVQPEGVTTVAFKNQVPANAVLRVESTAKNAELNRRTIVAHYTEVHNARDEVSGLDDCGEVG